MAGVYGYASQLGIDDADPVTKRFDFHREGLVLDEMFKDTNGLRGTRSHDISRIRAANRRCGGPISLQPSAVELALLLPWILGANASGTTYALADTLPTRYVTIDRVIKVFKYTGVVVNRATFRASEGEPLSLDLDLVGIDETVANAGTFPSLSIDTTTQPFMFTDLAWTLAATGYSLKEFEMVIDNNIDTERFFNSQTLSAAYPQDRTISFRTRVPAGDAIAAYNTGPTGVAVVGTFTNAATSLIFSMVKVTFPRKSPPVEGRSEIMLPLEGIAYSSSGTRELVTTLDSTP